MYLDRASNACSLDASSLPKRSAFALLRGALAVFAVVSAPIGSPTAGHRSRNARKHGGLFMLQLVEEFSALSIVFGNKWPCRQVSR